MAKDSATRGRKSASGSARPRGQGGAGSGPGPGRGPQHGPGLPFLAGLASGLLLATLVWLGGWLPEPVPPPSTGSSGETVPPPGIRFEFPDMLRDAEVLVPYVEEYLQPDTPIEAETDYILQAGAFRSADDADRRRAAILLLDLEARTMRVSRQGETWHRVLVGPFPARDRVRNAQLQLLEEDIDSIVLETRREDA